MEIVNESNFNERSIGSIISFALNLYSSEFRIPGFIFLNRTLDNLHFGKLYNSIDEIRNSASISNISYNSIYFIFKP